MVCRRHQKILRHAVLQHRLLAADFGQRQFAVLFVELLEAVEAIATVAHDLAAWHTLPRCLASSSSPTFARMIFCSVVMVVFSNPPRRGATQPRPAPRPASAIVVPGGQNTTVRLSFSYFPAQNWMALAFG